MSVVPHVAWWALASAGIEVQVPPPLNEVSPHYQRFAPVSLAGAIFLDIAKSGAVRVFHRTSSTPTSGFAPWMEAAWNASTRRLEPR